MDDKGLKHPEADLEQFLRQSAERNGRAMEPELLAVVEAALEQPGMADTITQFKKLSAICRAMSEGRTHTPSEELLRKSRDYNAK